jgi:proprotein convertase subtilisin/kexin type 5
LKVCQRCDVTCQTCSGSTSTSCVTCSPSTPYFLATNSSCNSGCPSTGYYADSSKICQPCDVTCMTCSEQLQHHVLHAVHRLLTSCQRTILVI